MPNDFSQILQRLDSQKLWDFPGGVHPDGRKHLSNQSAIGTLPLPQTLVIPVRQHIGTAGSCLVASGDQVLKGQPLTQSPHPFTVPVHAPTSGEVIAIEDRTTAHPSGLPELCVVIKPDGQEQWAPLNPIKDYTQAEPSSLVAAICDAGIAGMGGAGFPTHIKSTARKAVEFLIINGIECEPYITSDDRLMREHAWQIRQGIDILRHLLSPKVTIIGVEDNKPEAFDALSKVCEDCPHIRVVSVPTKYPAGGEKQLIQVLTGREVPRDGLPADIGVMMFNVGTCFAIADAILYGKPLIQRVVTLTGEALQHPQNVWALIGTPIQALLAHGQYQPKRQATPTVIMGGPMMGFTLPSVDVPVVKTTNCILVPAKKELRINQRELACIRCSACADACPASLLPQQLYWHSKAGELDKAEEYNLFDCIECGACAYVCPSEIPLVHYYRKAKSQIRIQKDEKDKAEKSKQRFEARKARLEREKEEREAKHRQAAEARKQAMQAQQNKATAATEDTSANPAKDKVAAALARAKAKKAAQQSAPISENQAAADAAQPDTSATDTKQDKVAAAIARAKAKKAQRANETAESAQPDTDTQTPETTAGHDANAERKAKVAAAIARAKAKKAAAQEGEASEVSDEAELPDTSADTADADAEALSPEAQRKAKIAAAVARAKAKKAAAEKASTDETETPEVSADAEQSDTSADTADADAEALSPEAQRKAKIAAAVARAKAKKAAAEKASTDETETPEVSAEAERSDTQADTAESDTEALSPEDQRKAKIAAAVARAKAKKAASEKASVDETETPEVSAEAEQSVTQSDTAESDAEALSPEDQRKAKIAAAVARAKAKKAATEKASTDETETPEVSAEAEPSDTSADTADSDAEALSPEAQRKAKIAAAVARAKAKKAARENSEDQEQDNA